MRRWTDKLHAGDHVLHAYSNEEERERAVLDLFDWLPGGAKMIYLSPEGGRGSILEAHSHAERMREAQSKGRFWTGGAEQAYRPDGRFSMQRTLQNLAKNLESVASQGFSSVVAVGDASWVAKNLDSFPEFLRYESSINLMELPLDVTFICQYDRKALPAQHLDRLESVHDHVLRDNELERRYWILPRRGTGSRMARPYEHQRPG